MAAILTIGIKRRISFLASSIGIRIKFLAVAVALFIARQPLHLLPNFSVPTDKVGLAWKRVEKKKESSIIHNPSLSRFDKDKAVFRSLYHTGQIFRTGKLTTLFLLFSRGIIMIIIGISCCVQMQKKSFFGKERESRISPMALAIPSPRINNDGDVPITHR